VALRNTAVEEMDLVTNYLSDLIQKQVDDYKLVVWYDPECAYADVVELHLVPDLNDGEALNIAPLHELVPWKEANKYWDELMEGKYEWSSIGKQLREKGLVTGH